MGGDEAMILSDSQTRVLSLSGDQTVARWSIVACIWLLTLTTFSMVGRTPEAAGEIDAVALLKLVVRAITLVVSVLIIVGQWAEPRTRIVCNRLCPFFLVLAWSALSGAWSPMKGFSLSQASSLLALVLLSTAIGCSWRRSRDTSQYLFHISVAMLLYSTVVVAIAWVDFDTSGLNHRAGVRGLVHPTAAGATPSLGLLIIFASALLWDWRWPRALIAPALIVHGTLLLLSSSRAAILLAVSLGLVAWLAFSSRRVLGMALLSGSVVGTLYLLLDPGIEWVEQASGVSLNYLQRGQSAEDLAAVSGRAEIWGLVWNSFLESPFFGHGYFMCSSTGLLEVWGDTTRETAHNVVLQVLVSTGLIGATLLAWAMCRIGASVCGKLHGAATRRRTASLACLLACWFFGWGMGCETFLGPVQPESAVFFIMVGLIVATTDRSTAGSAASLPQFRTAQ
jgi:O-antigen ligase